jgi:hypothetical protein
VEGSREKKVWWKCQSRGKENNVSREVEGGRREEGGGRREALRKESLVDNG